MRAHAAPRNEEDNVDYHDVLRTGAARPGRRTDHGADARRRAAGHRRVPARTARPVPAVLVRLPVRQVRPLHVHAAGGARTSPSAATPSSSRTCVASSARRARRCPSSTRSTTATTPSTGWRRQPWCDGNVGMFGDSYYGFTQWAAVASESPGSQGDRAARDTGTDLEVLRLVGRPGAASLRGRLSRPLLAGPEYLRLPPDGTHAPAGQLYDEAFRSRRRALTAAFDIMVGRPRTGERLRVSRQAPLRRAQGAGAALGWLVRQHRPRTRSGTASNFSARPEAGTPAVPGRRTRPTTRTTTCAWCRSARPTTTTRTKKRWRA